MSFVDLHFAFIARRRDPSLAVEANQNVGVEEEHSEPDAAGESVCPLGAAISRRNLLAPTRERELAKRELPDRLKN